MTDDTESSGLDAAGGLADLTDAQLRELVRADRRTPGALAELVSRAPRGLAQALTALSLDGTLDQGTRVEATAALGRLPGSAARAGLRKAVHADDPVVAQRAIERTGKVGTAQDLEELRRVSPGDARTERVLRTAKCFLSYRHGLGAYRFDEPKTRVPATAQSVELRISAISRAQRERLALLPLHIIGLPHVEPRLAFTCGPEEHLLAVNAGSLTAAGGMTERQSVPAVVTRFNHETGSYDPAYYLLTDPIGRGRFRVLGVRSTGRVALSGSAESQGDAIEFELAATDEPSAHPLLVKGTILPASGDLRIDSARVDTAFGAAQQARRRHPREVPPPR